MSPSLGLGHSTVEVLAREQEVLAGEQALREIRKRFRGSPSSTGSSRTVQRAVLDGLGQVLGLDGVRAF